MRLPLPSPDAPPRRRRPTGDLAAGSGTGNYAYYSSAGVATGRAGRYLPAAQGFWVEGSASTPLTLTFDRAWKAPTGAPVHAGRGSETAVAQLRLRLVGEGLEATEPVALFLEGGADGADLYDASWMASLASESAAATFVRAEDGRALVFEGRPVGTRQPLSVAVQTTRAGTYTLSWPALDLAPAGPLALVDLQAGTRVDLRAEPSYTFTMAGSGAAPSTGAPVAAARPAPARFEVTFGTATAADDPSADDPPESDALLAGVRPNPTAGAATLRFALPEAGSARVSVVDLLGRTVAIVAEGERAAGWHEVALDARRLPAGVYVVRLDAAGRVQTVRLTVAR